MKDKYENRKLFTKIPISISGEITLMISFELWRIWWHFWMVDLPKWHCDNSQHSRHKANNTVTFDLLQHNWFTVYMRLLILIWSCWCYGEMIDRTQIALSVSISCSLLQSSFIVLSYNQLEKLVWQSFKWLSWLQTHSPS